MTAMQREVLRYVEYWRPILGLEGWDIKLRFDETDCLAYCNALPKYLTATLAFNPRRMRRELRTAREREELVLHEMVHAVIWRASETAVSQVTLSLLRARAQGAA